MTVKKPRKIVVDLSDVFSGGIAYVMLSRIQNIEQLLLIGGSHLEKVYPSENALKELTALHEKDSKQEESSISTQHEVSILGCNIRSLPAHHKDFILEALLPSEDIILLQQTCLTNKNEEGQFVINGRAYHFNSISNGKGLVTHYNNEFRHVADICEPQYQMTLIRSQSLDIINVYRSSNSSREAKQKFVRHIFHLLDLTKKVLMAGDFNEEFPDTIISRELEELGFVQNVRHPTHMGGHLIDHVWTLNIIQEKLVLDHFPVYFTDHDIFMMRIDLS